jgi:hypothetical protein
MDKSRTSGALLWKTPVGEHNGHDNDSLLALSHQITLKFPYTGAIVYRRQLPTSANAPIAVFGNTVLVPAGGPKTSSSGGGGHPQPVAYTVPEYGDSLPPSTRRATVRLHLFTG